MAASTNSLTLLINQQDANGVNIVNRTIGAVSYAGAAGELEVRAAPDASIHTLDLPCTTVLQVYFKNTHATAVILLTGTISGGATQSIAKVGPGGVFAYWSNDSGTGRGFTELKYTSDTSGATFEFFFGG